MSPSFPPLRTISLKKTGEEKTKVNRSLIPPTSHVPLRCFMWCPLLSIRLFRRLCSGNWLPGHRRGDLLQLLLPTKVLEIGPCCRRGNLLRLLLRIVRSPGGGGLRQHRKGGMQAQGAGDPTPSNYNNQFLYLGTLATHWRLPLEQRDFGAVHVLWFFFFRSSANLRRCCYYGSLASLMFSLVLDLQL